MSTDQKSLTFITDLKQSSLLAKTLAKKITPPQLILLGGDLGSGKTAFVKQLAEALGITQTVTSPTFTVHRSYSFANKTLEHFDLFRLGNDDFFQHTLVDAVSNPNAIVIIEWPDKNTYKISDDYVLINFEYLDENKRKLTFCAKGTKSKAVIESIKK